MCNILNVSRSAFYDWLERPAQIISEEDLNMYRLARQIFKRSRGSFGSRQLCQKLREEGFNIGRYRTRSIMRKLKLIVKQRQAYKVTTKRKHSDSVADNLLNQQFNPTQPKAGLMFHSDRGSQYTSGRFSRLLNKHQITASMSSVGACFDNAVVERFFGSLKNEWLLNVVHLTREMKMDVDEYIRSYNYERLHTTLGNSTPINYEKLQS